MQLSQAKSVKTLDLAKEILSDASGLSVLEMSLSMKETIESPNIKSVFKGENATYAYGVARILVGRFMDSFGFSTKLSDSQIDTITVDTLENFSYDTLEDMIIFFKMARQGKLGAISRGVDSNLIFSTLFPVYLDKKAEIREQFYQKEKVSQKVEPLSIEDIRKAYDKIQIKESFRDKVIKYVDTITKGITRQELEFIIDEWTNDETKKPYIDVLKLKRLVIKNDV